MREVAVAVGPVLEETRNRLTIDVANGIAPCATDRSKVRQVLVHLVTNLARLSADSAIRLTVLPQAAAPGRRQLASQAPPARSPALPVYRGQPA